MADRIAVLEAGRVVQVGSPREVYRRPVNRFVAEFLGETNFIPGRVVERTREEIVVETKFGRLAAAPGALPAAGEVLLSIRPESFRPAAGGGEQSLRGRLVETVYLGDVAQHVVELAPGVNIRSAQLNPADAFTAPEGWLQLTVDPADVAVVPA